MRKKLLLLLAFGSLAVGLTACKPIPPNELLENTVNNNTSYLDADVKININMGVLFTYEEDTTIVEEDDKKEESTDEPTTTEAKITYDLNIKSDSDCFYMEGSSSGNYLGFDTTNSLNYWIQKESDDNSINTYRKDDSDWYVSNSAEGTMITIPNLSFLAQDMFTKVTSEEVDNGYKVTGTFDMDKFSKNDIVASLSDKTFGGIDCSKLNVSAELLYNKNKDLKSVKLDFDFDKLNKEEKGTYSIDDLIIDMSINEMSDKDLFVPEDVELNSKLDKSISASSETLASIYFNKSELTLDELKSFKEVEGMSDTALQYTLDCINNCTIDGLNDIYVNLSNWNSFTDDEKAFYKVLIKFGIFSKDDFIDAGVDESELN